MYFPTMLILPTHKDVDKIDILFDMQADLSIQTINFPESLLHKFSIKNRLVIGMNKVYKFSNENLTSYQELYDFTDKKVLSVIGSGDQYFSSIL